jgi:DNA invertase Pin-like site-specific DNA recombinase
LGTASGRLFANFLAVLAEWESDIKSERIKAALALKKALNSPHTPSGGKTVSWSDSAWRPSGRRKTEAGETFSGRVVIYMRCSHRDSAASGLGLISQANIASRYTQWLLEECPGLEPGPEYMDLVVTAYTEELRNRRAGRQMDAELQRGDHVIFSCLDRGFRNVRDMSNTIPDWEARGIHVHFVTEGIRMDDPVGKMMAGVICVFAQMEAELTSKRTKEAKAAQAARGRFLGGTVPKFWRAMGGLKKRLVLDPRQFKAFRLTQFLIHHCRLSYAKATARAEELIATPREGRNREDRPIIPPGGCFKRTRASATLPTWYPRDKYGTAHPVINEHTYRVMCKTYPEAKAAWDAERVKVRLRKEREAR